MGNSQDDALEIKRHSFFKDLNWELLASTKIQSPYKLKVSGPLDLRHFDKCFTHELIKETFDHDQNDEEGFVGFTYVKRFKFFKFKAFILFLY